jgi:hypothetical protein
MDVSVGSKALVKNTIPRPALCVLYIVIFCGAFVVSLSHGMNIVARE